MSEGVAIQEQRKPEARSCRHHWIIETPHGATSRGVCKRCGATKRFPNAAEDILWETGNPTLGRWSARGGIARPTEISLAEGADEEL